MSEIKVQIFEEIRDLTGDSSIEIKDDTPLLGDGSVLDSMKVVSLCLVLEDLAAEHEFEFDWTSDAAMSRSRSMFRTAGALAAEFLEQMSEKK